jgi:hypothetical protein
VVSADLLASALAPAASEQALEQQTLPAQEQLVLQERHLAA